MRNQITCPNCQTTFQADIQQIVDVGQNPQLKYELLNGRLNIFVCPNCGLSGQMATPLLYHDPEHELLMVHVPMELSMPQQEQEQMIGKLVQAVMENTPPEQRKGYMLQPQTIINYESFIERILETEGITPEMIRRQRKQGELLQTLVEADRDVRDILLEERGDEIDETFFAMLNNMMQAAQQQQNEQQLIKLSNLQAKLFTETEIGREIERRQMALHRFQRDVREEEQLTPRLLLKHVLKHKDDEATVDALVTAGQQAFNYEFFSLLTEEIEEKARAHEKEEAKALQRLRAHLRDVQQEWQEESQKIFDEATETLQQIVQAEDMREAIRQHQGKIDDAFMYVLSALIRQAEQQNNREEQATLQHLYNLILEEAEKQVPPEVRLINDLVRAETEAEQRQLLAENEMLVTPELAQMLGAIAQEMAADGQDEMSGRVRQLQAMVEMRV